jgi:hypothetical protein
MRMAHRLTHFDAFSSDPSQVWISSITLWIFLLLGLYAATAKLLRRQLHRWDSLLLVLAACVVIYLVCRGGTWQQLYGPAAGDSFFELQSQAL